MQEDVSCNFCSRELGAQTGEEPDRIKRLFQKGVSDASICERCLFEGVTSLAGQCPSVISAVFFNSTSTVGQLLAQYGIEDYLSQVGIDPGGMTIGAFFEKLQKAFSMTVEVMEARSGEGLLEQHIKSLVDERAKRLAEVADLERAISEARSKAEEVKRYALKYTPPPVNPHESTNPDLELPIPSDDSFIQGSSEPLISDL